MSSSQTAPLPKRDNEGHKKQATAAKRRKWESAIVRKDADDNPASPPIAVRQPARPEEEDCPELWTGTRDGNVQMARRGALPRPLPPQEPADGSIHRSDERRTCPHSGNTPGTTSTNTENRTAADCTANPTGVTKSCCSASTKPSTACRSTAQPDGRQMVCEGQGTNLRPGHSSKPRARSNGSCSPPQLGRRTILYGALQ